MKLQNLNDVLTHQLKDLYSAEQQLTEALPKMAQAASSEDLRRAFEEHLEQTKGQLERLREVGKMMEQDLEGETCKAMKGLIAEGQDLLKDNQPSEALDAALIAAAQRVEHYEIAAYGSAATYAQQLGHKDAKRLLGETLDEEERTDQRLTRIAEGNVNREAMES